MKYGYQEAGIYKTRSNSLPRRFGQIRMYAAKDVRGDPVMVINSIDLESEERRNLFLYRKSIDYAADFARLCGFRRLLIGRHADMAIGPFEKHEIFADLNLRKIDNEQIELSDHFPADQGFNDIFGGEPGYGIKKGTANFYELNLRT